MQKVSAWSIAFPIFLFSIGFILVGTIGYAMSPDWLSAQQIQNQAVQAVPKPIYPPPPSGGQQQIQSGAQQVCTQIPSLQGGFPPKITMRSVCSSVPTQTTVAVGPSTSDTKNWQDKVDSIRLNYETTVNQEASRISERQRSDLKSYVKDMIQISTGILGLVTGMATLVIGAIRGKTPQAKETRGEQESDTTA